MNHDKLFNRYLEYTIAARNAIKELGDSQTKPQLSRAEFVRVFRSISTAERTFWMSRFEHGFANVLNAESDRYAKAVTQASKASLRSRAA